MNATLALPVQLLIENRGAPKFVQPPVNQKVQVNNKLTIQFSDLKDPDPDDTGRMKLINWGNCERLVDGRWPKYTISPVDNLTDPGICNIYVTLVDDNPVQMASIK